MSRKSEALTYLEPLGPVQACCGRPLPLPLFFTKGVKSYYGYLSDLSPSGMLRSLDW